jgi:hypothetical protein
MRLNIGNLRLGRNAVAFLLLFGYMVMTLLAIEQARTIANQRVLIQQLFQDSLELSAVRMRQLHPQR